MKRLSLTARLSLMFMLAVTLVLGLAGLSFHQLSVRHFKMLDQHTLEEKLQSTRSILSHGKDESSLTALNPQLTALFGAHRDLTALMLNSNGEPIFALPESIELPSHLLEQPLGKMWEWQTPAHLYRGLTAEATLSSGQSITLLLMLDVTHHVAFLDTLQRWLAIALLVSAVLSAGLGWLIARSGLLPLRQVTALAMAVSASSLQERIALKPIPQELQELVSAFNAMLARLEDAFVRLSNFSADIAHELRTPLSNLLTQTEVVLTRPRDNATYAENLASNLEELQRMSRMIDDMLFLAKSDNGLIVLAQAPVALEQVVDKLLDYYRLLADERDIQLERLGQGTVAGDSLMLHRAISNLLSNALRYTPEGGTVFVDIESNHGQVNVVVRNPGETIATEHLHNLFERFYRADSARREGGNNAGLGLAITRSIVAAHHGKISCSSAAGWTEFQLEFRQMAE